MEEAALDNVRVVLDRYRRDLEAADPWPHLSGSTAQDLSAREANLFLLGAALQYQITAETAWKNAQRLDALLGMPEELWDAIVRLGRDKFGRLFSENNLHRFKNRAGVRIFRIAQAISSTHRGDARSLWAGQPDATIRNRLLSAGLGTQISEMILGALLETGHADGCGQIKADMHTKRVLGRVFSGAPFNEAAARSAARVLYPQNPRLADRGLFQIGRDLCHDASPICSRCPLTGSCTFSQHLAV